MATEMVSLWSPQPEEYNEVYNTGVGFIAVEMNAKRRLWLEHGQRGSGNYLSVRSVERDRRKLYLIWQHRQTFVFAGPSLDTAYVSKISV
jgi:hypothetical protein